MKLEQHIYGYEKYRCDLTKELDVIFRISNMNHFDLFYHYVLADEWSKRQKCLVIRVPGRTIGGIHFDENNIITKVIVDKNYITKTYSTDANDVVKKYVGEMIEW